MSHAKKLYLQIEKMDRKGMPEAAIRKELTDQGVPEADFKAVYGKYVQNTRWIKASILIMALVGIYLTLVYLLFQDDPQQLGYIGLLILFVAVFLRIPIRKSQVRIFRFLPF